MTTTQPHGPAQPAPEDYHHVEDAVRVYLCANADGTGWQICHTTLDGYPLFSDYDKATNDNCECGPADGDDPDADCDRWRKQLGEVEMPDAQELLAMLADQLGYDLVKRPA